MDLVRVAFALIPANPLFDAVVDASQAITNVYAGNRNIIDSKRFPPHISLHICAIPATTVGVVTEALGRLAENGLPQAVPTGPAVATGGYVMLGIGRTSALLALHEGVTSIAAQARAGLGGDLMGSRYTGGSFRPHLSLAKLAREDQARATAIAREVLAGMSSTACRSLELCDIGERSERWEVLASFPAAVRFQPPGP